MTPLTTTPPAGRLDRLRRALSSDNAIALAVAVALVALALAAYVTVAQINLTSCLARYNELQARSTAARAQAGAEDRLADAEARDIAASDRAQDRMDDAAMDKVVTSFLGRDRATISAAFAELLQVRRDTAAKRADNDGRRAVLEGKRAASETRRRQSPVPDPPSEMCG